MKKVLLDSLDTFTVEKKREEKSVQGILGLNEKMVRLNSEKAIDRRALAGILEAHLLLNSDLHD